MVEIPTPLSGKYHYDVLFRDICRNRFYHLITRFFAVSCGFQALVTLITFSGNSSLFRKFCSCMWSFILLYLASMVVVFTRKNYMHVQYLGYHSIFTSFFGKLASFKSFAYLLTYSLSSFLICQAYDNSLGLLNLKTNWKPNYQIHTILVVPMLYMIQHVLFDRDRLSFKFETQIQLPQRYLQSRFRSSSIKVLIMTVISMILLPFVLCSIGISGNYSFIYACQLLLNSFVIIANLQLANVAFDAHMSIGCLHKGKLISDLSSSPMETLISGLTSNKLFVKITAFQELACRGISSDLNVRTPIYQTRQKNVDVWSCIFNECTKIFSTNNEAVTKYLQTLKNSTATQPQLSKKLNLMSKDISKEKNIFGHMSRGEMTLNESSYKNFDTGSSPGKLQLRQGNVILPKRGYKTLPNYQFINTSHAFDEPIITHKTKLLITLQKLQNLVMTYFQNTFKSMNCSNKESSQLTILEAVNISKIRIAESLIPIPALQGYSVLALMGFFLHALDEDPKGSIVSSVSEVLKVLERSVATLGKYTDWKIDNKNEKLDNVSRLYELSVSVFLEIVLKYSVLLNDVYLDNNVVTLSEWVLEMCNSDVQNLNNVIH